MNIKEIMDILPHRYPFLLVDRVIELEAGKRAVGIKNVTMNEPFFQGHFPGYPVMPGVLIAEALAQLGAVAVLSCDEYRDKLPVFAGMDKFRFRKQVLPGDQLRLEADIIKLRGTIGKGHVCATVEGEVVAEGEILFALTDVERKD
ncbi:MAG TPA: 3-hydroxyacyl-ACP dehydratase FabZ [Clostridiales bacterium]|nr:3-hydroxyacyl-ACP dehydratase FabZ [Clostridiales bacterium]